MPFDNKEYYQKNKASILAKQREYKKLNKDKNVIRNKKWRHQNRVHLSQRHSEWQKNNSKHVYAYQKKRNARLKAEGKWHDYPEIKLRYNQKVFRKLGGLHNKSPFEIRMALQSWSKTIRCLFNNKCQVCGGYAKHSHHIIHKAKYPVLALNVNNGIALCVIHHREAHGNFG